MTEIRYEFREFTEIKLRAGEFKYFNIIFAYRNEKSCIEDVLNGERTLAKQITGQLNRLAKSRELKYAGASRYPLAGYSYGELKPDGFRIFFFRDHNDLIFFECAEKKKNSLGSDFYKRVNKKYEEIKNEYQISTR